jgi:hypothetical protein
MNIILNPKLIGDFRFTHNTLTSMLFRVLSNTPEGRAIADSSAFLIEWINSAKFFENRLDLIRYSCAKSLVHSEQDDLIMEFGVYEGESLLIISKFLEPYNIKCFGFDTFTGLTHDWVFSPELPIHANAYNTNGITPKGLTINAELVIGDASQTSIEFLA